MKKVANKKIIRTLSYRTMKEKKGKNLVAVLAIALTSLLFTALFTIGFSMIDSMQEATMRQVGTSAHGGYKYASLEEYEKVKAAGGYTDISYDIVAGAAANEELNSMQVEVRFAEDKMAKWSFCYPKKGEMPKAMEECAASSKVLEALGVPMEIGARVPMKIRIHDWQGETRVIEQDFTLCGYWQSNEASHAQEFYISREWLEENVELLHENFTKKQKEEKLFVPEGSLQVGVWFDSALDIEGQMEELTKRAGLEPLYTDVSVNWAYAASTVDATTVFIGVVLLFIIMLSGYLIIYNIFYINVTTDIRYYGLLKTIGTTGKQLRSMVRGQAFLLAAAGVPLGLLSGWLVGKGVLPTLYTALDTGGVKKVSLNPWIFAGAALFSLIVVYISCIKPCKLATRVSPIEAVRYVENSQYKKKNKKTGRVTMARMSFANMSRNRKKAAAVIASLSLSLILINSTYCLVKGFDFDEYVSTYLVSDLQLSHYSAVNLMAEDTDFAALSPEILSEVSKMKGVEKVETLTVAQGKIQMPEESIREFESFWNSDEISRNKRVYGVEEAEEILKTGISESSIYGVEQDVIEHMELWKGNYDPGKFEKGGYAIVTAEKENSNWVWPGDTVILENNEGIKKEFQVMAAADMPYGMSTHMSIGIFSTDVVISRGDFEAMFGTKGGLHGFIGTEEGMEKQVEEELRAYIEEKHPELALTTKEALREEFSRETNMFSAVGGLLGFILSLIGILNFTNAMITSVLARKQEFAVMQAVGMTGKQLRQMLTMEGLWYGAGTLITAVSLGSLISFGLLYMIGKGMAFFTWHFSILPFAFSAPVILLIAVALPYSCYHTLCKRSIIERLRLAEV